MSPNVEKVRDQAVALADAMLHLTTAELVELAAWFNSTTLRINHKTEVTLAIVSGAQGAIERIHHRIRE